MFFDNWLLFVSIAFIATATPGPAVLLVSAHSLSYGAKKATLTIMGNITGLFFMSALSILGLSAIILSSAPIFFAIKIIGALYLIYLGIKIWIYGFGRTKESISSTKPVAPPKSHKLYRQGLFVALSNPKAIAFTTALFPQFIEPDTPLAPQFFILVLTFMFLSFICLLAYAAVVRDRRYKITSLWLKKLMSRVFGAVFIGYGVAIATTTQK